MPTLRLVVDSDPATDDHAREALGALTPVFHDVHALAPPLTGATVALLRDLAFAIANLAQGKHGRGSILVDGWEVGLELCADTLLVSVFSRGADPHVAQAEREVPFASAQHALLEAIGKLPIADRGLALAREALLRITPSKSGARPRAVSVELESNAKRRLVIGTRCDMRPLDTTQSGVARADLHALLFRGNIWFSVGNSRRELEAVHVFLFAEQLVRVAEHLLDARSGGFSILRRIQGGSPGTVNAPAVSVRLDEKGRVAVLASGADGERAGWRLPSIAIADFVRAVVSFARRLTKKLLGVDASQRSNLRVLALRRDLARVAERVDGGASAASKLNIAPESYRAFAESDTRPPPSVQPRSSPNRLRFEESWRADVPGVDLRSIYLAGEHLLVGSTRELACIERVSGLLVWKRRCSRAISILTPAGLAQLGADGALMVCDIRTGETLFEAQLSPCVGASASGAVVAAAGLPRMLLVADGARHLCAIDLDSREVRWRRALRPRGAPPGRLPLRLRRAGKLMIATAGDSTIAALDVLSGEIVWRHCGDYRYLHAIVEGPHLFALSSELVAAPGPATLECIDPWSGVVRWRATLPRRIQPLGPPLCARDVVLVPSADEGHRTGVVALSRASGELVYDLCGGLCAGSAALLMVDDALVANSDSGELVAIEAVTSQTRYRHVFGGSDRPSSMSPVLRAGALFIPQSEAYVVRPQDGAIVARVPTDLVPDALRVDDRCGVYVAESSGYLAAYRALPTLSLVE